MFKAADVGRKEGTRFRTVQQSRTIVCRFLFPLLLSLSLTSSLLPSFCISILPRCLSFSLSLFLPLAIFLLLPFRDATMCVVRRGSRQGRLANNTLQFFRSPPPPASPCPSRPLPTAMPPREKGKKVPKIQGPVRKSSSMNASTSPSALNRHPPYPLPCERRSSSAITFGNLLYDEKNYLSLSRARNVSARKARNPGIPKRSFTISLIIIDFVIFNIIYRY